MKQRARLEENSGLIDLDALLRQMNAAPPSPMMRATVAPAKKRRRPAVLAMVLLSVGGNALALASAAASTFSSRRKSDAPVASASVPVAPVLPETEGPPSQRGAVVVNLNEAPTMARMRVETDPAEELGPPSYAPRHAVPPPPPAPAPEPVTSVTVPQETPKPTLDDAMRLAVGQSAPTVGPPRATVVADVPSRNEDAGQLHPAPGAVIVALTGVQSAARACLQSDDEPRAYTVIFSNEGQVARVEGPSDDGKGSCIRAALSQARVGPFVEESYRARVTIRP